MEWDFENTNKRILKKKIPHFTFQALTEFSNF